jgi:hypothetical protein
MEKRYMMLENKLCKELELLEEKYRTGAEMSEGDLRRIDLLVHSMKSLATYTAMKQAENNSTQNSSYNNFPASSYDGPLGNSYGAYSNNMNMRGMRSRESGPDMSGHYPYYPEERRW